MVFLLEISCGSSLVAQRLEDPALSLLWLGSLLWDWFDPWPEELLHASGQKKSLTRLFNKILGSSCCGTAEMNLTSIREDVGLVPGLNSVGWGSGVAVSCGVGPKCSLGPVWLWLAAVAPIRLLAWELPYVAGAALKSKNQNQTTFRVVAPFYTPTNWPQVSPFLYILTNTCFFLEFLFLVVASLRGMRVVSLHPLSSPPLLS